MEPRWCRFRGRWTPSVGGPIIAADQSAARRSLHAVLLPPVLDRTAKLGERSDYTAPVQALACAGSDRRSRTALSVMRRSPAYSSLPHSSRNEAVALSGHDTGRCLVAALGASEANSMPVLFTARQAGEAPPELLRCSIGLLAPLLARNEGGWSNNMILRAIRSGDFRLPAECSDVSTRGVASETAAGGGGSSLARPPRRWHALRLRPWRSSWRRAAATVLQACLASAEVRRVARQIHLRTAPLTETARPATPVRRPAVTTRVRDRS
jgi:hypothetical protein